MSNETLETRQLFPVNTAVTFKTVTGEYGKGFYQLTKVGTGSHLVHNARIGQADHNVDYVWCVSVSKLLS